MINLPLSKGFWFIPGVSVPNVKIDKDCPGSRLVQLVSKYSSLVITSIKKTIYFALYTIQCWAQSFSLVDVIFGASTT